MAMNINGVSIRAYVLHLHDQEGTEKKASHTTDRRHDEHESPIRISLSRSALERADQNKAVRQRLANLTPEEQLEIQGLSGELETMVQEAGGFRYLTGEQWDRVEQIHGRLCEINGEDPEAGNNIAELREIYSLEEQLDRLYAGEEPLTSEKQQQADAVLKRLHTLLSEEDVAPLAEEEEQVLGQFAAELADFTEKMDQWTLTPEDEKQVNTLWTTMESFFQKTEQQALQHPA